MWEPKSKSWLCALGLSPGPSPTHRVWSLATGSDIRRSLAAAATASYNHQRPPTTTTTTKRQQVTTTSTPTPYQTTAARLPSRPACSRLACHRRPGRCKKVGGKNKNKNRTHIRARACAPAITCRQRHHRRIEAMGTCNQRTRPTSESDARPHLIFSPPKKSSQAFKILFQTLNPGVAFVFS